MGEGERAGRIAASKARVCSPRLRAESDCLVFLFNPGAKNDFYIFNGFAPRVARESWGLRSSHCRAEETSPRRVSG